MVRFRPAAIVARNRPEAMFSGAPMPLATIGRRLSKLRTSLSPPAPADRQAEQAAAREQLLRQFESLGENCELGFVQEHLGSHNIGLFRWAGVNAGDLITALNTDLAGVGSVENSAIYMDEVHREYCFRDTRYGMHTHTKIFERDLAADKALATLCKRTARLCEKLLEDLSEGEKIFVFQSSVRLSMPQLLDLHEAVRRLGPTAELLYVHAADGGSRAGEVKRVKPGLIVGVIDRAGFDGVSWTLSYEVWLELLAKTARICGRQVGKEAQASLDGLDLPRAF